MTLLKYSNFKWTRNSFIFKSSHKIGRDFINVDELVCDALYLSPVANIKQWYTSYLKKRLIIVIFTELYVQSINDVAIPDRELNELRDDAIRLSTVYVFDVTLNEILETIF